MSAHDHDQAAHDPIHPRRLFRHLPDRHYAAAHLLMAEMAERDGWKAL
jgi:hypothetical protein